MEEKEGTATLSKPKIIFDRMIYNKIMHWVHKASGEVSGLGTVESLEDGTFKVISAIMLPQSNTGGSTDIEAEDVAKAMYELRNEKGTLNFWWHSHVNMGVFWSGTDTDTIRTFGNAGGMGGFVIATVFNKRNEWKNAIYLSTKLGEKPIQIFIDDAPAQVMTTIPEAMITEWDAEFTKNEKKPKPYEYKNNSWIGGRIDQYDHWGAPIDGVITLNEILRGCTTLNGEKGWAKFPLNRLGYVVGEPVKEREGFSPQTISKVRTMNERLIGNKVWRHSEYRADGIKNLDDEELDYAAEMFILDDDEYYIEMQGRSPSLTKPPKVIGPGRSPVVV